MQLDSMDEALRTGLWNVLVTHQFAFTVEDTYSGQEVALDELKQFCHELWVHFFKLPIDTLPTNWQHVFAKIREFFFSAPWNEVYDFIEVCTIFRHAGAVHGFIEQCNRVLERELSAYRFVSGRLTSITAEEEIREVEEARQLPGKLKVVEQHLSAALSLLADRKNPDYRNSIKESVSAIESVCSLIAGQDKADLGAALRTIEKSIGLHKALKTAFNSLYGYTSDANGIRHALLDEPSLTFNDAKFMLVACSAFVNYLKASAARAGVAL